jgi:hypothetical protein
VAEKEQDTAQDERSEQQDEKSQQQDQRPQSEDGVAEESGRSGKVVTKAAADSKEKREKKSDEDEGPAFSIKRLHWAELVGFVGAGILAASLFLPWFSTDCESRSAARTAGRVTPGGECNPNSVYNGKFGEFTAFGTFKYLDWLLLAACIAPFVLAYIIARAHSLTWRPGEVTMIVGMVAFSLILLNGIILGKPGDTVDMKFEIGWLVGLFGSILIMFGGILRQALAPSTKKPPGVM